MPFDDPFECFTDILENIGRIEVFLQGMGPVELQNDQRTVFACQYALLVISEAAKRLGLKRGSMPRHPVARYPRHWQPAAPRLRQSGFHADLESLSGRLAGAEGCRYSGAGTDEKRAGPRTLKVGLQRNVGLKLFIEA
ncbi:MAG TPA: HepT-like ribonuclease domain-containing protein [Candidatus Solibacter sp.]|nr:HepT-like ribonuclease domain-containing protein [Candidatus Solibacter sp.]